MRNSEVTGHTDAVLHRHDLHLALHQPRHEQTDAETDEATGDDVAEVVLVGGDAEVLGRQGQRDAGAPHVWLRPVAAKVTDGTRRTRDREAEHAVSGPER